MTFSRFMGHSNGCTGNPLEEKHSAEGDWRDRALTKLPRLKKLDGITVVSQTGDDEG